MKINSPDFVQCIMSGEMYFSPLAISTPARPQIMPAMMKQTSL